MNYEIRKIQFALKDLMKARKATYFSLAKKLKVSPATIKRRLNGSDISIKQLKELAESLSLSFYELIELSVKNGRSPYQFTDRQELFLSKKLLNILLFRHILAGASFSEIQKDLKLTETGLRKAVRELEEVGLAVLLPGDRLNPLVRYPFEWKPNGLLSQTYNEIILKNIYTHMRSSGDSAGINRQFELSLSEESYKNFCSELDGLFLKYRNLSDIHLSYKVDLKNVFSGVIFVDKFSVWNWPETARKSIPLT